MEIKLPADCGNAPRIVIMGDFAVNWARSDTEAISEWLATDATWTLIGGDRHSGPAAAREIGPPFSPDRVEIISITTHGRLASCDGYLEAGQRRIDFSHAIRFASTSKTAKIAELRSYCIETQKVGASPYHQNEKPHEGQERGDRP
ncbi:MAG TPA: hypothetical protein VK095_12280 [Beutenbergiaceae bacterium]|nr:hypothetical protein [Beutenbergiaceae bacterium]